MITQDIGWWDSLLSEFCRIYFVCSGGEPNWIGWVVLVTGVIVALFVLAALMEMIQSLDE